MYVLLRTGAVVELRRSQGWRMREHISCHQSLGTWVWRQKMSRTSLEQVEWPVEFKCDFNIITRELSRAILLFSMVIIKSLYKKSSNEIWAVQGMFQNRFNRGPWRPDPMSSPACQQFDWHESTNKPTITTPPSSPRRGGRKNAIEQTFF